MKIMTAEGDQVMTWDPTDEASVSEVKEKFDELVGAQGAWAYKVGAEGDAEQVRSFDEQAETIVVHRPMAGG